MAEKHPSAGTLNKLCNRFDRTKLHGRKTPRILNCAIGLIEQNYVTEKHSSSGIFIKLCNRFDRAYSDASIFKCKLNCFNYCTAQSFKWGEFRFICSVF